jgi:acetate---CoA ligase (ADP-forming)
MDRGLNYFFEPRSVAVIGASGTPGKAGNEILVNMLANGYAGRIFPVNPAEEEILGFKAYRSVKDIPESVDLAVFIIPAEKTLAAIRDCAEKKIPAAVIASGGYAEVDQRGENLQNEILKVAKSAGMRIIGPNTSGLTSTPASLTTTFFPIGKIRRGPISYIAQTGNFATHTMKWIMTAENYGVARVAGLGNKIDVEDAEVLGYLGNDPETKAVLMYVEGFRNPRRFFESARQVAAKKPVIMLKGGRTQAGAARAYSHTASMSGNDLIFDAACKQAGVVRVKRYFDLIHAAKAIAFQALPPGRRMAALAPSGALGVVLADACESLGLKIADLSEASRKKLREISASWVNISNPVDMSAITPGTGIAAGNKMVLETLLKDEGVDAIVPILLASPKLSPESYSYLPELSAQYPHKPIYVTFTGDQNACEQVRSYLEEHSIPVFIPLEETLEALLITCRCGETMQRSKG